MSYRKFNKETNDENTIEEVEINNKIEDYYKNNENNYDEEEMKDVIKAFEYFDMNNNGKINISEIKQILTSYGDIMTENEINNILITSGIEQNIKENINYMEFINFFLNKK